MSPTFHAETIRRRESGFRRISATTFASWSTCLPSAGRPASPLVAVDRTQFAVRVGPFVPDRDSGLLQRPHVRLAAQEPEELVDDGLRVHLLRRQQREAFGQREAHLVAEHGERAGAGAIVLAVAAVADMPHEIEVLAHRRRTRARAKGVAWIGRERAGAGIAKDGIVAFRGHNAIRAEAMPRRAGAQGRRVRASRRGRDPRDAAGVEA